MTPASERRLRMRAPDFGSAIISHGHRTRVRLPKRARLSAGQRVHLEVSFGPMADEVDLFGVVAAPSPSELGRAATNGPSGESEGPQLDLDEGCEAQLAYVLDVLGGQREAAARRYRRFASNLPVRWTHDGVARASHLADISTGGAFIIGSTPPPIGDDVVVQLRSGDVLAPLVVDAVVSWHRQQGDLRSGFGVNFHPQDPSMATRLKALVRAHEGPAPSHR